MPTFYRVVGVNPPERQHFTSNKARGKPPRGPERDDPELWEGLSVYNNEEAARIQAKRIPSLGSYLARLAIPTDSPISYKQTLTNPAHYTIWGDPEELLAIIEEIIDV